MNATTQVDGARRRTDYNEDQPEPPPLDGEAAQRAARAAADERYGALLSSGSSRPSGGSNGCPGQVANPVLFRREGADADAVDVHDVQQGPIGDCFVMAPLAGLASTPEGRALIKSAISENRNDQGEVVSYTVTLHKPESHWWGPTTFEEVKVTVTQPFVCNHADARADGNQNEVWPLVIEKAYAQYCHCNPNAGSVSDAMEVLTGREATRVDLGWLGSYDVGRLQSDLAAGKVVVLATKQSIGGATGHANEHNLVENHAYVVTGVEMYRGRPCVTLHNPWNCNEPDPVPYSELKQWFASVNIASVTP